MSGEHEEFVVNLEEMRRDYEAMRESTKAETGSEAGISIARASARIVRNAEIEVRAGKYTFRSDEPQGHGGKGAAPRPLQYFAAGVAT